MAKETMVGIVMGSDSDLAVMKEAASILDRFGITYHINIISAHRTPHIAHRYAKTAQKRGLEVIIAGAGGAAHLAGVIASLTPLPVIGVPIYTEDLKGTDSFVSTLQMPSGVPVATMSIGKPGAKNAGILAAQIIGVKYPDIRAKVKAYKLVLSSEVKKKDKGLKRNKWQMP